MNKEDLVLNFIFPGDTIRLRIKNLYSKCKYVYKEFLVKSTVLEENLTDQYFILERNERTNDSGRCSKVEYFLENCSGSGILVLRNILTERVFMVNKIFLKKRKKLITGDFCTNICSVRFACQGKDDNCEFHKEANEYSKFLLGDKVGFEFLNKSYTGIVNSLFYDEKNKIGFTVNVNNSRFGKNVNFMNIQLINLKVIEKKSVSVTFNPCNICMLKSCDKCEFKRIEDFCAVWEEE